MRPAYLQTFVQFVQQIMSLKARQIYSVASQNVKFPSATVALFQINATPAKLATQGHNAQQ